MDPIVICPQCGNVINIADPRVRKLTPAALHVWEQTESRFRAGELLGPTEIANQVGLTPSTVFYHLRLLTAQGLLRKVPQRKLTNSNGHHRARHLYTSAN